MAMELVCALCLHVNTQGEMECEKCGELLPKVSREYFVKCMDCKNDVFLESKDEIEFYCDECGISYPIDGLIHRIQVRDKEAKDTSSTNPSSSITNELLLEERESKYRIHICQQGGILGRYGDFNPEFFQNNNMLMVSGEHLIISYDKGDWYLEHIGRNSTKLDGMELEKGLKFILKNDQALRIANVGFKVIIGESNGNR